MDAQAVLTEVKANEAFLLTSPLVGNQMGSSGLSGQVSRASRKVGRQWGVGARGSLSARALHVVTWVLVRHGRGRGQLVRI